jgi:hypothetical protein
MARVHGTTGTMIGFGAVCVAGTLIVGLLMMAFGFG